MRAGLAPTDPVAIPGKNPSLAVSFFRKTSELALRLVWTEGPILGAGDVRVTLLAPWIVNNSDGRARVEHCADVMEGFTLAAEFRHKSWFSEKARESTLAMERERGFVNVVVDEPNTTANSIPAVWEVTNQGLALVRLHGRNHETWNIKGAASASSRFNYDHTDDELGELAGPIGEIAKRVERTHAVFNNNYEDQGQRNARAHMHILGQTAMQP